MCGPWEISGNSGGQDNGDIIYEEPQCEFGRLNNDQGSFSAGSPLFNQSLVTKHKNILETKTENILHLNFRN